jgi:hypothetical protein
MMLIFKKVEKQETEVVRVEEITVKIGALVKIKHLF